MRACNSTAAVGYRTIGMLHSSWGDFQQAEEQFEQAIAILERISSEYPSLPQYRYQLGYAHLELSRMLMRAGRSQEARTLVQRGIEVCLQLLTQQPHSADYISLLANHYIQAVRYDIGAGKQPAADPYPVVFELLENAAHLPLIPPSPSAAESVATIGHRQRDLAFTYWGVRRLDEAGRMFQAAIQLFRKLRDEEPSDAEHWHFLADTHRELGLVLLDRNKPEEAEQELRRAIQIHEQRVAKLPDDPVNDKEWAAAYSDLARLLAKAGRSDEIAELLRREAEVNPSNGGQTDEQSVKLQSAKLLCDAGDNDGALTFFAEVIAAHPENPEAWLGRGQCRLTKGEFEAAIADFSEAIERDSSRWEPWSGRGFAHFRREEWEEAAADFSQAITRAPEKHTNWYHRGRTYLALSQWTEAVADFTRVVEGWPNEAGGWYLRSLAFSQLNQPEKALADLKRAIALGYKDVEELTSEPKFEPLRDDHEFKKLLEELQSLPK